TVHYFSASHLDTFVRSVYAAEAVSQRPSQDNVFSKRHSLVSPSYVIKSDRAIVLNSPTPQNEYQYIWITSPMIPKHSLHHLLFQKSQWTFIDYNNSDYKIWSIYSILKSVESMHSHKLAHLAIDLRAFYFDHEMKATDWRLGNLGYTRSKIKPRGEITFPSVDTQFTAPEIIQRKAEIQIESVDIWSLGCVIYTVATGGLLLFEDAFEVERLSVFHDDMKQHVKIKIRQNIESNVFRNILEMMLQVNPSDRKSINEILNYWDSIYNME
ncbi:kinase-like domain-containing protein, partial [Parasitella parasitica]